MEVVELPSRFTRVPRLQCIFHVVKRLQCRASLHFLKSAVCWAMTLAIACPHSPILFSLKRIALFKLLFMPLGKRLFVSFLSSDFDMEI